ncbi:MAG: hypothetical protein AABY22_37130 [Nanoarchaeota archaeon]
MYEYKEYKGKKILVLKRGDDDNYPFSFGKAKAKLIIDNLEIIKKFVKGEGDDIKNLVKTDTNIITRKGKKQSTLSQQD